MRYIKSYANDAAIQAAVENESLGKPYVALNESAGTIDWNSYSPVEYEYISLGRRTYSYNSYGDSNYFFRLFVEEKYYTVRRGYDRASGIYYLTFTSDGGTVYYLGDNLYEFPEQNCLGTSPDSVYSPNNTIYSGELFERRIITN